MGGCQLTPLLGILWLLKSGSQLLLVLCEKCEQVAQKSVDSLFENLVEDVQMFDVKLNRNPLNNFRPHILLPLNILLLLLPLPLLLNFLLLLLPLNLHNLALHNLVEIDKQLPLKSFDKHHQSIANFNFGNIGREINIPVTLQQNHSNFILSPFVSRKKL